LRSLEELAGVPLSVLRSAGRPVKAERGQKAPKTRAEALSEMGVTDVLGLLTYYPRRYLDRTTELPISELKEGEDATVLATVRRVRRQPARRGGALVFQPALASAAAP
jgi:RecG-like helicase